MMMMMLISEVKRRRFMRLQTDANDESSFLPFIINSARYVGKPQEEEKRKPGPYQFKKKPRDPGQNAQCAADSLAGSDAPHSLNLKEQVPCRGA